MHCLWVVLGERPSHFSLRMPARSAPAQNVFVTPSLPQPQSQMESGNPPLCKEERTRGHCPRVTAGMAREDPGGLASSGETYKLPTGVWGSRWEERGRKPLLDADFCPDPGRQGSVPLAETLSGGQGGQGALQATVTSGTFPSSWSVLLAPSIPPLPLVSCVTLGKCLTSLRPLHLNQRYNSSFTWSKH